MKSLKGVITKFTVFMSAFMAVVGFAVLLFVVYFVYSDHSTSTAVEVLLPVAIFFILEVIVSVFIALKAAKTIITPINRLNPEDPKSTSMYRELSPLAERIEAQNAQIAEQIANLRAEHEKQDAMRRDFTANVSHELKTPLTSISGYAELIKTGIAKEEDVKRFAGKIYDESQRLITLVGDIIKLSQLDGKEIPVTFGKTDLYGICESVISHFEIAAKERNITMELQGDRAEITSADRIVEEMIFNLCDNAVKYNRENGHVTVNIHRCVDGVEVTVSDTGIGIPEEDIDRIFERFYRVDKSHSKEIGGTGLGLSIVKHGAKFLGASVSVESKLGEGTTVRLVF